jgi:hypothetical protein
LQGKPPALFVANAPKTRIFANSLDRIAWRRLSISCPEARANQDGRRSESSSTTDRRADRNSSSAQAEKGESKVKLVKMFGLAVVAAIAAMAFVGASSASATSTVLCKENVLVCPTEQIYTGHVEGLSKHAVLKGPIEVLCEHSLVLGEAGKLASPLVIAISKLTFTQCGNCTVTVEDEVGEIKALKTASNLAEGEASGFKVKAACGTTHCTYGGVAKGAHGLGSATNTSDATIVANEVTLQFLEGSFLCFEIPGKWTATYNVLLPLPIYIAE